MDNFYMVQNLHDEEWEDWIDWDDLESAKVTMEKFKENFPNSEWRIVYRTIVQSVVAGSNVLDRRELNERDASIEQQWESSSEIPGIPL